MGGWARWAGDSGRQRRGREDGRWRLMRKGDATQQRRGRRMAGGGKCSRRRTGVLEPNSLVGLGELKPNLGRCEDRTTLLPPTSRTRKATVGWKSLAVVEAVIVEACIFTVDSSIDRSFIADRYNHGPTTGQPQAYPLEPPPAISLPARAIAWPHRCLLQDPQPALTAAAAAALSCPFLPLLAPLLLAH